MMTVRTQTIGSRRREAVGETPVVPVIMCTWKRPALLQRNVENLLRQTGVDVDFFIWNNNPQIADVVEGVKTEFADRLNIEVRHSNENMGAFGRVHYALALKSRYPFIVFIDDDQDFDESFLETLWRERIEGGVLASYARWIVQGKPYWERTHVGPGGVANYCGPGGAIVDDRLLHHPAILCCPERYAMLDDLWLSYVFGHVLKVPIRKSTAQVSMIDKANDSWPTMREEKAEFLEYLRGQGWEV